MRSDLFFIFEIANNHQGSLEHGLAIVDAVAQIAGECGARGAVKLQYRDLDSFIHPDYVGRSDVKHVPRFLSTRLAWSEARTLVAHIRRRGLQTMVTPFDERSVELAVEHEVDILKVASCSAGDWPLLERIAAAGKPVIASTGGTPVAGIDKLVTFFEHRQVADVSLMHCVSLYPTPAEAAQLGFLRLLQRRYPHARIGYSGHEAPGELNVVRAAVALGARLLERHVGIATENAKLNAYSLDPLETRRWVMAALEAERMCEGSDDRYVGPEEAQSIRELARGTFAARPIRKGERLSRDAVFFAMPTTDGQTTSGEFKESLVASRDYATNEAIYEHRVVGAVEAMREAIHQAKGMLREAQIEIGPEYVIELSHHYGEARFHEYGAILVGLINREYCKKLLIMLPGQKHPAHMHRAKDETFQLLAGDLSVVIDGKTRRLVPGDLQLVERGQLHEFCSERGCIMEEVSTTHVRGDSYYADPAIAALDPMQRKTVLEMW